MNPQVKPETKSYDESLFVLKYRGYKVFLRLIFTSLCVLLFGFYAFIYGFRLYGVPTLNIFKFTLPILIVKVIALVLLVALTISIFDLLFFEEIRLYKDRIVQMRRWRAQREITLANASLQGHRTFPGSFKTICIRREGSRFLVQRNSSISYDESLADPRDTKELNRLLADLSGRKVEEFDRTRVCMEKLIKKDKT